MDIESGLPTMSAEEDAFFASGGESPVPDAGSDTAGDTTGGDNPDGGNKSADQGNKPNDNKAPQHVPLAALQEERGKRKALADQVKAMETQLAEMRGKFSIIDRLGKPEGGAGEGDKPAAPPTVEDDIFAVVKHQGETIAQMNKRLEEEKAAKETADKQAAETETFRRNYLADAN